MNITRLLGCLLSLAFGVPRCVGAGCDLSAYRVQPGLAAVREGEGVTVTWEGESATRLRLRFSILSGVPTLALAVQKRSGPWIALGRNLTPTFTATSGIRRANHGLPEENRWDVFWDAPLEKPEEVRQHTAQFETSGCTVKTDGRRLEIQFPGASMGVFSGKLQFTIYRGANLIREELIAKTDEPSLAYIYTGGLSGFSTAELHLTWQDVGANWQEYDFSGEVNKDVVPLRAKHRLAIATGKDGSMVVFPPPHQFFFAREVETNLGYVWYRKDSDSSFSLGVRQHPKEEAYNPEWRQVYALYNAPPGTWQHMAVYFYASASKNERLARIGEPSGLGGLPQVGADAAPEAGAVPTVGGYFRESLSQGSFARGSILRSGESSWNGTDAEAVEREVLAFTHGDRFKALPGFKTMVTHFHTAFTEELVDSGSMDTEAGWIPAMKALGINIAYIDDFHGDGHPEDPGPLRLKELENYYQACRHHSNHNFLILPGEEANVYLGGHYNILFPKPVYWTHARAPGGEFLEHDAQYGPVYHASSAAGMFEMVKRENALVWQTHPRTKGSTFYPDRIRHESYFLDDHWLGAAFKPLPIDLSQKRLCELRCFGTLDDMNNWGGPKFMLGEVDTYKEWPQDELYAYFVANYLKLDSLPAGDDWSAITRALRAGDFFVTTGEVLIREFNVRRQGDLLRVDAELEWTFPLDFVEVVWGDGENTKRKVLPATQTSPFGRRRFSVPISAPGKKWVRFAAWDSAGNGAFTQPVYLREGR